MAGEYRVLSHTADTGIAATGDSFESVVAATAVGMFALMYDLSGITPRRRIVASVVLGDDLGEVLIDALSELLFLGETEGVVCTDVTAARPGDDTLRLVAATASTAGIELVGAPVKAVTYHDLEIGELPGGRWHARVYFDT
jgi:SHS2 domain-containing protein